MDTPEQLSAALEGALLRELAHTWDELNGNHFRGRMKRPPLSVADGEGRLGFWDGALGRIALSRTLILRHPWSVVREVLKHEMAHQFVHQIMGVTDESAHGPAFERLCRDHGFDASARGLPEAPAGADEGDPVLRRVSRLLALATSSNVHEALAAMNQAQRLMLKHNIDVTQAALAQGYRFRQIGVPQRRIDAHEHSLACLLGAHFFVDVIWVPSYDALRGTRGRVLEICGTPSNLEVAVYVHEFLTAAAERLWRQHRQAQGIQGDRDRRRFLLGVITGFADKLRAGAAESRQEGLIYVGDPELARYLRKRYPRRSAGGGIGIAHTETFEHGRRAGQKLVLHRGVHQQSGRGRLLSPVG